MPRRKKTKSVSKKETAISIPQLPLKRISRKTVILIVLFVLVALFWNFRSSFIVAMVNGQPISRWQLNDQLVKKFGAQILDSIVNERLILAGARQQGIFVKSEEIDSRVKQIEQRLQGQISLDDALKAQGLTRNDFRRELEIQISIEKLFDKESTLSASEIDDYISKNKESYKDATDPAAVREEVSSILRQQKINDSFEKWFTDIKNTAKITKFL